MSFTLRIQRSGKYWAVHVVELDRWTQARSYRDIEPMVRDLLDILDADRAAELRYQVELPAEAQRHLTRAEQAQTQAETARQTAAAERRAAARSLTAEGITQRDAAALLGISHQRMHQLLSDDDKRGRVMARRTRQEI